MKSLLSLSIMFAAGLSAAGEILPALAGEGPEIADGGVIVVTGSRIGTALADTPASIQRLDRDRMRDRAPSFTGEVLNQVPGVYMSDLGNEQHSMSIRMPISTNAYYLYLEDGIPLRPLGLFNHNALYEINLDGGGAIEVQKGPASSLYGSNSVGGTINLLTEAPAFRHGGLAGLSGSDEGYGRANFAAETHHGDFALRMTGYASGRRGGWQDHNDADKESVTLRGDYHIGDSTVWSNVLTYSHLKTDMPGTLNESDYRRRPGYSYQSFTDREVHAGRFYSRLAGEWNAGGRTSATLFLRDNSTAQLPSYLIFDTANPALSRGRDNDNDFWSVGFDVQHTQRFSWADSRLTVGAYFDHTNNDYLENNLTIARDPVSGRYLSYSLAGNRRNYTVDLGNRAIYGQFEVSPTDRTRLVLGGRYDVMSYDYGNRNQPSATTGAPSERRDYERASFRLGFIYNPAADTSLYINLSEGFTPPEVSSLYGRLEAPNLRESVYKNIDLGLRQRLWGDRVILDASLYRLTGKDEVVSYTLSPGNSEPRNAGETRHQGVELGLDLSFDREWTGTIAAAWSKHTYDQYRVSPTLAYSGNTMPGAPRLIATSELVYKPAWLAGSRFAAEWVHMGGYWMDNANAVRYGGHDLVNLRASYGIGRWAVSAKLMNATNRHYAEVATSSYSGVGGYDADAQDRYTSGAPRTVFFGIRYQFGSE